MKIRTFRNAITFSETEVQTAGPNVSKTVMQITGLILGTSLSSGGTASQAPFF